MPNAAATLAVIAALYCLAVFDAPRQLFRDSDTGWHIRTGETILRTGQLPYSDPYSFSRPGAPWFAWEWGADAGMGLAHRAAGLRGVAALYVAAIALSVWLWFQLHWASGSTFLVACSLLPPMVTTASLHWLARPHIFGWIALMAALLWAERGIRRPWLAVLLGAAWANVHASFFLAPMVFLAFAAFRRPRQSYLLAAAGSAAGSFLNPYGWHLHGHIARYLSNQELLRRIAEFQTFNFQTEGAGQVLAALCFTGIGAVLAATQRRWHHAALLAMFFLIGIRSARGLPLLAMAALPMAGGAVTRALPWSKFVSYSEKLRAIDRKLPSWPAIPVLALLLFALIPAAGTGFPSKEFPALAAGSLPEGARVFAPDKFGGYLIYRFEGTRKVFFDGRSDFYGLDFMKEYVRMVETRPGWPALFDRWRFSHALLAKDAPLRSALELRGWRKAVEDDAAILLEAPGDRTWTGKR